METKAWPTPTGVPAKTGVARKTRASMKPAATVPSRVRDGRAVKSRSVKSGCAVADESGMGCKARARREMGAAHPSTAAGEVPHGSVAAGVAAATPTAM